MQIIRKTIIILLVLGAITNNVSASNIQKTTADKLKRLTNNGHLDTVILINNNKVIFTQKNENQQIGFDWQRNMPWLAAILIGILTVGSNVYVSSKARKSSLELMKEQLDSNTKNSLAQIATAQKNSERDFNKTVLSGNRQIWITQFRDIISQLLSSSSGFIYKQKILDAEFEEVKLLIMKAELMLDNQADTILISALENLQSCYKEIILKLKPVEILTDLIEDIKSHTKSKIENEWFKVKNGI